MLDLTDLHLADPSAEAVDSTTRPLRVLLAHEDELTAYLLADVCAAVGHEVEVVSTGHEALERVAVGLQGPCPYDAIVVSPLLPTLHGAALCSRIRRLPGGQLVALLVVSDAPSEDLRLAAYAGGADAVLARPFSPVELRAALAAHVSRIRGIAAAVLAPAGGLTPAAGLVPVDHADTMRRSRPVPPSGVAVHPVPVPA